MRPVLPQRSFQLRAPTSNICKVEGPNVEQLLDGCVDLAPGWGATIVCL